MTVTTASLLPVQIQELISQAHQSGKKVVLVTGVFDLLHQEHRNFLQQARLAGDVLVVGVESDVRVTKLKGVGRPIQSQLARVAQIEALGIAQGVFVLPDQFDQPADHEALIALIRPAVLAVSAHTAHQAEKSAILAKFGGQVIVVHTHNPAVSTTQLVSDRQQKEEAP
jgi:rfaE bifunctional protein nucleotidyltransferase chain/domain